MTQQQLAIQAISEICDELKEFLKEKNTSYGNSAFEPIGIFNKTSAKEKIGVRIDDKLSRLHQGQEYPGDDTVKDLAGYLILHMAFDRYEAIKEQINRQSRDS